MFKTPNAILLIHSFISAFLITWLGMLLINYRPAIKKLFIVGFIYSIFSVLLRGILNISFDISFIIQIILLLVLVLSLFKFTLIKAFLATFFGTIVLAVGEAVFLPLILKISGFSLQQLMTDSLLTLLIPLPQIIMISIFIFLCSRYGFYLIDLRECRYLIDEQRFNRNRTVGLLVLLLLTVILEQILFNIFIVNNEYSVFHGSSIKMLSYISSGILIIGVFVTALLLIQLIKLVKTDSQFEAQSKYIEALDEMYTAIRSERHDIINHLQTIYGFNQLGYTNEVQKYLSEMLGESILSNDFVITGTPGLTALLYIKSNIAKEQDIAFHVSVNEQIIDINIPPYELNTILGNLINNAFDAVMNYEQSKRVTNVDIEAENNHYIFKVSNYGHIDDSLMRRILKKGYTTKEGDHSGLGLHICNLLIKKYNGHLEIINGDNQMVQFIVRFPRNLEKRRENELSGQKAGAFAG